METFPPPRRQTLGADVLSVAGSGAVPMLDPESGEVIYVSPEIARYYGDETEAAIRGAADGGNTELGFLPLLIPAGAMAVSAVQKAVQRAKERKAAQAAAQPGQAVRTGDASDAAAVVLDTVATAIKKARDQAQARKAGAPAPTAPPPAPIPAPAPRGAYDAYGNPVRIGGPVYPNPFAGSYLGGDDYGDDGQAIGYDDAELRAGDAEEEDAQLREDDAEIAALEGEEDAVGDDDDTIGDDETEIGATQKRKRKLARREKRISKRLRKAKSRGRGKRAKRLEKRLDRIDKVKSRIAKRERKRNARRAARAQSQLIPPRSQDDVAKLIATLPIKGDLVRVPLLSSGASRFNLTGSSTAANTSVTVTGTSAGISYAELRFVGLLVQVSAGALAGPASFRVNRASISGGLQVIYGAQLGMIVPTAVSSLYAKTSTTAGVAYGSGIMWIPGLRDKPRIKPTGQIVASVSATFHTAGQKSPCYATVEAICDVISDPQAGVRRRRDDDEDDDYNDDDEED